MQSPSPNTNGTSNECPTACQIALASSTVDSQWALSKVKLRKYVLLIQVIYMILLRLRVVSCFTINLHPLKKPTLPVGKNGLSFTIIFLIDTDLMANKAI